MSIAFGIPFWTSWVFVFCWIVYCIVGYEEVDIDSRGLHAVNRAIFTLGDRRVPLAELREFIIIDRVVDDSGGKDRGIEVRTLGKPLRMFFGMPDPEIRWLVAQMSQLVAGLPEAATLVVGKEAGNPPPTTPTYPQQLVLLPEPLQPPSDCAWTMSRDSDALCYDNRGRWSWLQVLGLLFVNCFWNGVVAVFLLAAFDDVVNKPQGAGWWGMMIFLVPFEGIGLCMFIGLLATIAEPFRVVRWSFRSHEIEYQWMLFGLGRRRRYAVADVARLDIDQLSRRTGFQKFFAQNAGAPETITYRLSVVGRGNVEQCDIAGLTEGEARWIGDSVLRARPDWQDRPGN